MKGSSLHAMVRLRRPLRCDYVIQTDHMEGNSLHAMLGLHRAEQPLEKQLPARYAAITSSRVTTERQVPACYAAITSSKMITFESPKPRNRWGTLIDPSLCEFKLVPLWGGGKGQKPLGNLN